MKNKIYIINGLAIVALILFVIAFEFKGNYYKISTEEILDISLNSEIVVSPTKIIKYSKNALIITLNKSDSVWHKELAINIKNINIDPSNLLNSETKAHLKKKHDLIVLESDDLAVSAKAWIILSRKGYKNIRVLSDKDEENIKYTFQPKQEVE